jgi:hypothetical protein
MCEIKAHITQPALQEEEETLNKVISEEMAKGAMDLDPGNRNILGQNIIISLMRKYIAYKKGWITKVLAARQRAHRKRSRDDEIVLLSKNASTLYKWLKNYHLQLQPRKKARRQETEEEATINEANLGVPIIEDHLYLADATGEQRS